MRSNKITLLLLLTFSGFNCVSDSDDPNRVINKTIPYKNNSEIEWYQTSHITNFSAHKVVLRTEDRVELICESWELSHMNLIGDTLILTFSESITKTPNVINYLNTLLSLDLKVLLDSNVRFLMVGSEYQPR